MIMYYARSTVTIHGLNYSLFIMLFRHHFYHEVGRTIGLRSHRFDNGMGCKGSIMVWDSMHRNSFLLAGQTPNTIVLRFWTGPSHAHTGRSSGGRPWSPATAQHDRRPFAWSSTFWGFLYKYSSSWQASWTMMTTMVTLPATSSIARPWYHHLQKLRAYKVV